MAEGVKVMVRSQTRLGRWWRSGQFLFGNMTQNFLDFYGRSPHF
ncbi:MAG: hypothetical protein ACP5D7_03580 [Limnospira sp.]